MKTGNLSLLLVSGLLIGLGPLPLTVQAGDAQQPPPPVIIGTPQDTTPDKAAHGNGPSDMNPAKKPLKDMSLSPGLNEIINLKKGGVDDAVILSFIQSSQLAYRPNAQEILQLRENGVSTAILVAILQHGAEVRQRSQTANQPAIQAPVPAATASAAVPEPTPVQPPTAYSAAPTVYAASSPTVVYAGYPSGYAYGGWGYPGYYSCYPGFGFYPGISLGFRFGGGHFGGFRGGLHHR